MHIVFCLLVLNLCVRVAVCTQPEKSNTSTSPFLYNDTAGLHSIPRETGYKSGFFIMSNHLKHNLKQ